MLSRFFVLISACSIILFFTAAGPANRAMAKEGQGLLLSAGSSGATYQQVAESLRQFVLPGLKIIESAGSKENIERLKNSEAQLGLCQMDILNNEFLYDEELKKHVRILLPLYSEEVHVLAKRNLAHLSDLENKKVAIGKKNSGTNITARVILRTHNISRKNSELLDIDFSTGLKKLLSSEIDALFLVAGAPVKSIENIPAEKFHLLSLAGRHYDLLTGEYFSYDKASLGKEQYKWQEDTVKTISVQSVLLAQADLDSSAVSSLVEKVFAQKKKLDQSHTKWSQLSRSKAKRFASANFNHMHPAAASALTKL